MYLKDSSWLFWLLVAVLLLPLKLLTALLKKIAKRFL